MSRRFKACLLGATLNTGNRGVAALAASLVKLVLSIRPDAEVAFLIGNETSEPFQIRVDGVLRPIAVVNYRMSPRAAPREHIVWVCVAAALYRLFPWSRFRAALTRSTPWIKAMAEADFVGEIRGGDSFSDIYGFRRFLIGSIPVVVCILVRGRVALLPQTYGPFKSTLARILARFILRHAETIISRDQESIKVVENLAGRSQPVHFCPDVAFVLDLLAPDRVQIDPVLNGEDHGLLIGLNISGLMYRGGYTRDNMFGLKLDYTQFLVELTGALLENVSHRLLLVPHTFSQLHRVESDPAVCAELKDLLPPAFLPRVHLVRGEYDQHEIKALIGKCDFFIGSRMHACIAALSQGIPTIGVAYSKKFKGVFESVGVADCVVDGRDMDVGEAVQKCMALIATRHNIRQILARSVPEARSKILSEFRDLLVKDSGDSPIH